MNYVADFFFSLLKFVGLPEEPPPIQRKLKRNRVYDDFSSDDETPEMGYQHVKRIRWSGYVATFDNDDNEGNHNNSVRNVPVHIKDSYTTSTPKESPKSPKRQVPVDLPGLSKNGPSSPLEKTNDEVDIKQKDPKVAWVESKLEKTKKEPCSMDLHVELDDDDSQRGDDVIFVKEVTSPPEHVFATNSHAVGLNYQVLEKIKSEKNLEFEERLRRIANTIIPMSKDTPIGDGKRAEDSASFRLPKTTKTKNTTQSPPEHVFATNSHGVGLNDQVLEKIKSEKNLDFEERLRRIANTIIPMSKDTPIADGKMAEDSASFRLPMTTKIKNTTQHNKILNEIKLHSELNSDTYQNAPQDQDPIRVSSTDSSDSDDDVEVVPMESSTTSSIRKDSKRNITELSRNVLLELGSECNNKLSRNQATINDARRVSDITSKVNSQQNDARSSSPESINDWLAKKDGKHFSTLLKNTEKLNDVQQIEARSYKPDIAGAGLSRLEYINKASLLKLHEKYNYVQQESNIVSKVNTVRNEAKLDTTREFLARLEVDYFSTPTKTKEYLINARHESNIVPNDIRSCLPAASRDWLLELDAKYKTTPQKNLENLNNARQELNNVSKVNGENRSPKPGSTDDWLAELKSRLDAVQTKKQEDLDDTSRKSVIVKRLNSNPNKSCSHKPDTARETLSKSDTKPISIPIMQEKLNDSHQDVNRISKINSEQNEARSFKFNTSEDLMLKLGCLYNKWQQETQGKRRKSLPNPEKIKQVNREQKHELSKSKTEKSNVEMQSNIDLPALTPKQERLVERAFKLEPETEMLVEKFNMRIHRRDLQTLSDLNWLNDEVINFYMNLIMQRSEKRKNLPKVYATNTFFYPKLEQGGQAGLRRWTRKVDIFGYDLFMVPVNIDDHWCLSIVDFRERIIKYLDSRGSPNKECLDALLEYLKDEHQDKKGAPLDISAWKTECVKDIPQQMNGSDCGMFACTFAEFSSRDAAYSFTQAHMPYLRRKAALEILMGKLLL